MYTNYPELNDDLISFIDKEIHKEHEWLIGHGLDIKTIILFGSLGYGAGQPDKEKDTDVIFIAENESNYVSLIKNHTPGYYLGMPLGAAFTKVRKYDENEYGLYGMEAVVVTTLSINSLPQRLRELTRFRPDQVAELTSQHNPLYALDLITKSTWITRALNEGKVLYGSIPILFLEKQKEALGIANQYILKHST